MKTIKLILSCLLVIALFSCARSRGTMDGNVTLVRQEGELPGVVFVGYQDSAIFFETLKIDFELHLENIDNHSRVAVEKLIYQNKSFEEYVIYRKNEFIGTPVQDNYPPILDENGDRYEDVYFYNSDLFVNFNIKYFCDLFAIIEHSEYHYYSGTAHGNFWMKYYIIDFNEEKILTLDELVNQIPDNILKEIITAKFDITMFLRDNIWPPDAVNPANGNLELIWNPYSITPWSEGIISINIPVNISLQYLTEKGGKITLLTGNNE